MLVPTEVLFSGIKGGVLEASGSRGWWWRKGKLVAEWKKVKGRVVVTWHYKRSRSKRRRSL